MFWSNLLDRLFNYLKTLPTTGRIIVLLLTIAICGYIAVRYFIPAKKIEVDRPGQCDYLMEQNKQLVDALLEVRKNLKSISIVSYHSGILYASYVDTTPQQRAINRVIFKIDSILVKNKRDSIRKVDSLKKVKHG